MYSDVNLNSSQPVVDSSEQAPVTLTRSISRDTFSSRAPMLHRTDTKATTATEKKSIRTVKKAKTLFDKFHEWKYTPLALIFAVILLIFFSALGSYLGYKSSVQVEKGDGIGADLGEMTAGVRNVLSFDLFYMIIRSPCMAQSQM